MSSRPSRDPSPIGRQGELALIVFACIVIACAWCAVAGVSAVTLLASGTWIWPETSAAGVQVVRGLVTGNPDQGWQVHQASQLPGPAAIYTGAILGQLFAAAATCFISWVVFRVRLPNDGRRGLASRHEAAQVLGLARLRKVAPVIRPDLTGKRPARDSPARTVPADAPGLAPQSTSHTSDLDPRSATGRRSSPS